MIAFLFPVIPIGTHFGSVRYSCPFRAPDGEVREIVVELSQDEIADCQRQVLGGDGPGAPGGPIERMYAWHRAVKEVPVEFAPVYEQAQRITVQ